jgi:hypothetical protein
MKMRSVGAELFHADRQRDMMKLLVAFRCFAYAPKNVSSDESIDCDGDIAAANDVKNMAKVDLLVTVLVTLPV